MTNKVVKRKDRISFKISIYRDQGVNLPLVRRMMKDLSESYQCSLLSAEDICCSSCLEEIDLLIIPGGRDLPYVKLLQPHGTDRIRKYVEEGGCFLGICAGAYFGSSYVEFDQNGPLFVEGERALQFFKGKTVGPLFGPFEYDRDTGAKIVPIVYEDKDERFVAHSYYNGGCTFEPFSTSDHRVLATYADGRAAVVRCVCKKGLAILSGVHFEKPLRERQQEEERVRLMSTIFQHFELHRSV